MSRRRRVNGAQRTRVGAGWHEGTAIRGRFPCRWLILGKRGRNWLSEGGLQFRGLGAETSQELFSDWSVGLKNSADRLEAKNGN